MFQAPEECSVRRNYLHGSLSRSRLGNPPPVMLCNAQLILVVRIRDLHKGAIASLRRPVSRLNPCRRACPTVVVSCLCPVSEIDDPSPGHERVRISQDQVRIRVTRTRKTCHRKCQNRSLSMATNRNRSLSIHGVIVTVGSCRSCRKIGFDFV